MSKDKILAFLEANRKEVGLAVVILSMSTIIVVSGASVDKHANIQLLDIRGATADTSRLDIQPDPVFPELQPTETAIENSQLADLATDVTTVADQATAETPAPIEVNKPPETVKKVIKPAVKPKPIGLRATLNNYDTEKGRKVCTQDEKDEHPGVSSKGNGIHVDEDCCIDPDEIPNLNCYYPPTDNARMNKAMNQARANIGKKLGSKYHK